MGKAILIENTEFETEAKKIVNDWEAGKDKDNATVSRFRLLVNSAPANLRYGDPNINSGIGKYLDPMGDINQKLTSKEKQWNAGCIKPTTNTICTKCNCNSACRTSTASNDGTNYYVCK